MSHETKRLFIGGLASSITEEEIESRFEKFGEVSGVNLVKKDSVNGTQEHCFAHFNYKGDDKQLKKLISTFNNTRWKGKTVRIEPAKEDFLDRLAQEKKLKIKVNEKARPPKRQDILVENFKKAGVEDFVKKKAVPGTAIEGEKNWVVGKYGRVLPVVYLRRKDKRKVTKFDPSKYSHHLKQIKDEDGIQDSKISSFTWDVEGNSGLQQKRQMLSKGMKGSKKNKNAKNKRSFKNSGYMFNFFGNDDDGDDDQEDDTSSEAGTVNQEDSESDSDTSDDSGPSVPTLKKRKTFDKISEESVNAYSHDRNITTLQDTCQLDSSENRGKDSGSDSADTNEICASKQRQCKEGKVSSKEGKHKVKQEKYSSFQDNCSERIKRAVTKEKSVRSGELEVKDTNAVKSPGNILTGFNDNKSSRDGSRHDAGPKHNVRGNKKGDHVSDSTANDSDDTSGGGGSVSESVDTDEICNVKQKQNQIKLKTEKYLHSMKMEDENAEKKQENISTGGGFNYQGSSGSGSRYKGKAEISGLNNNVEDNVADVGRRSDDTSGSDDSNSSEEEETESEDDLAGDVEMGSGKQKQRQADAKTEPLSNKDDIDGSFVKTHTSMVVNEETATSVKDESGNQVLVWVKESGSVDPSSDTSGSSLSSTPSLKRKRDSHEGLSDTDRRDSSKRGRMEGEDVEQHSYKKVRQEKQTSIKNESKIGPLSPQGNLRGAKFELLVLDRDILAQQGYNTPGVEGEESSLEDGLELSESGEDSSSDEEKTKGKKKNKLAMPEFKGMNFFRTHLRDGEGNDWKEKQTSRGQDVSTDEMNARSKEEFNAVKEEQLPGHKGATSRKKKKRKKYNDLESGDGGNTLDVGRSTQLKMKVEGVSWNTSDEYVKEQLNEGGSKNEMPCIERQDEENFHCEVDDSQEKVTSESKRSQKLMEDLGRGRDADDESSELENSVNGDNGSSSRKRKKKKKHKEKQKEEENENITRTGKNSAAFTDSLSLINAVQNKYSKESGHPHSPNARMKEESVKVIRDGLEGNELQSERGTKGESSVISSGAESMEDATKSFTDRMAEFGQKIVNKRKLSDGGRNDKEYTLKQKRQVLPEKKPTGIVESKNEKSKMDISNQDTAEISNQKRLQAIKERQDEVKTKQKAIQAALAKVDERKQPDAKNHMRFDSESEEDPEVAEEVEQEKNTSKEPSLALFADENNEESGSDEDWFQVKPQFEGEKGQELLKLQRKFGDDERFKLDERFAEEDDDEEGDDNTEDKHEEDGEEGDLETEKTKALSILENVLGNMLPAKKSTDDKKTKFRDMGQIRFDPSREDHEKFLLPRQEVSETNSKPKKKRKKKKQTEEGIVEAPLPEVSKEVFFDVKSDLTSALSQSEQVTFGFFNDNEDKEETQENKEEEYFHPPAEFVWAKQKLPYDSSESEGEAEEMETTKQDTLSVGNSNEMEPHSSKGFFFGRNDHRLKDGAFQFCRPKDSPLKDNWEERRTQLWAATYKRHQKALRDNKQNRKQRRPFKHH